MTQLAFGAVAALRKVMHPVQQLMQSHESLAPFEAALSDYVAVAGLRRARSRRPGDSAQS